MGSRSDVSRSSSGPRPKKIIIVKYQCYSLFFTILLMILFSVDREVITSFIFYNLRKDIFSSILPTLGLWPTYSVLCDLVLVDKLIQSISNWDSINIFAEELILSYCIKL